MLKYAIWLSLACATLLDTIEASPAANGRHERSIWPFVSYEPTIDSLISKENALILKKAGLEKSLDLGSHPLWKVHKYEGIDLKPVRIETEVIKADPEKIQPSSTAVPEAKTSDGSTATPVDLSFLNDLGGLAQFLPDPKSGEKEASDLIADAIKKEEANHPGFFKKLWGKIWGAKSKKVEALVKNKPESGILSKLFGYGQKPSKESADEPEVLTIYLPQVQGNYAAVFLPAIKPTNAAIPTQQYLPAKDPVEQIVQKLENNAPIRFETLPPNHSNQLTQPLAEQLPAPRNPIPEKPVAQQLPTNSEFSRSQAWIQSWTPHASYNVHVQGPEITNKPPVETSTPLPETTIVPENTDENRRKYSEGGNETETSDKVEGQVQLLPEKQEAPVGKDEDGKRGRDILLGLNLPEALLKKFQVNPKDVEAILNDKTSTRRANERLRALQREFEMRKDQLSYAYAASKKQSKE